MDPAPAAADTTLCAGADGSATLEFELPRFGVSLVTLAPLGDGEAATTSCAATDGSVAPPRAPGCACREHAPARRRAHCAVFIAFGALLLACGLRRAAGARRRFS
jgi:hypothetical protein